MPFFQLQKRPVAGRRDLSISFYSQSRIASHLQARPQDSPDCRPEALGGFAQTMPDETLEVVMPYVLPQSMPKEKLSSLKSVLAHDPRPSYQDDPRRVYGISFAGHNVRFTVAGKTLVVTEISQMSVEQENNN